MSRVSFSARALIAVAIWAVGLALFFALGWWNINDSRADAENRLIGEAGRIAAQLAGLLSLPGTRFDEDSARAIVAAAMEDERVYAVKIDSRQKMHAGERRNYLWEPVPWDDEIAENCVQGMNPVRMDGQVAGRVEVWLSPRSNAEEESLLVGRELARLGVAAFVWTAALVLLLWYWGDFRRIARRWGRQSAPAQRKEDAVSLGLGEIPTEAAPQAVEAETPLLVDPRMGRLYQRRHPDAWFVTAGLFRQTFSRAPKLLTRLYSDGEIAGLCHLGRILELAAPCIGARPLEESAREMQRALNDPLCAARAAPVEDCARILEETLEALGAQRS